MASKWDRTHAGFHWRKLIRTSALGPDERWAILTLEGQVLVSHRGQTVSHTPPSAAVHLAFAPNGLSLMVALAHGGLWSIQP